MKVTVKASGTDRRFDANNQRITVPIWQVFSAATGVVMQGPFDSIAAAQQWVKASRHTLAKD